MTFKIGDVVGLKSGGPKMTVHANGRPNSDALIDVCWFDGGQSCRDCFRAETLVNLSEAERLNGDDAFDNSIGHEVDRLRFAREWCALRDATSPKIAGAVEDLIAAMLKRA